MFDTLLLKGDLEIDNIRYVCNLCHCYCKKELTETELIFRCFTCGHKYIRKIQKELMIL